MNKEQPEALPARLAKRLCDGISTGHDWPNTDDELLRMQSAAELRRLVAVEQELEALKRAISEAKPVAWMVMNGVCNYQLCGSKKSADHLRDELQKRHDLSGSLAAMSVEPLYTLKGIK